MKLLALIGAGVLAAGTVVAAAPADAQYHHGYHGYRHGGYYGHRFHGGYHRRGYGYGRHYGYRHGYRYRHYGHRY